jgi:hypothetical protein
MLLGFMLCLEKFFDMVNRHSLVCSRDLLKEEVAGISCSERDSLASYPLSDLSNTFIRKSILSMSKTATASKCSWKWECGAHKYAGGR